MCSVLYLPCQWVVFNPGFLECRTNSQIQKKKKKKYPIIPQEQRANPRHASQRFQLYKTLEPTPNGFGVMNHFILLSAVALPSG